MGYNLIGGIVKIAVKCLKNIRNGTSAVGRKFLLPYTQVFPFFL